MNIIYKPLSSIMILLVVGLFFLPSTQMVTPAKAEELTSPLSQPITSFPYTQDFEGFSTCDPDAASCPLSEEWSNATDDQIDWTVDVGGTASSSTGPSNDHNPGTGSGKYLYTEATSQNNKTAHLVSPQIVLPASGVYGLSFWYHMYGVTMGTMHLDVSTDDGATWSHDIIPAWTGNQNAWREKEVNLGAYAGESQFRFRIRGITGYNSWSDMAIDDVSIFEFMDNDVGTMWLDTASSGCGLTTTEDVTIRVKNQSGVALSNIPVSYTVSDGTVVNETIAGPLASLEAVTYNFSTKVDLSVVGSYQITATTQLAGDANDSNNSSTTMLTSIPTISTFPYMEDFESGANHWLAGGSNRSWAHGAPSGNNLWVTNLTGNYNNNERSYVLSPCFNLSSLTIPQVELDAWWNTEHHWDGASLQYSTNGGSNWTTLGTSGEPHHWYTTNYISAFSSWLNSRHGWTGNSGGWRTAKHGLTGLAGQAEVRLRVAFGSGSSQTYSGFGFDNVVIKECVNQWTGAVSTDWDNTSNWACSRVPEASHEITIPSAPANQPMIQAGNTATVNNLTIDNGASLTLDETASLTVDGDLTINGTLKLGTTDALTVEGSVTNNGALEQSRDISDNSTVEFLSIKNIAGDTTKYYGLNMTMDGTGTMGLTSVRILGNQDCTNPAEMIARRCFNITPTNTGSGESAKIRYWLEPSELNSQKLTNMAVWHWGSGTWSVVGDTPIYGDNDTCSNGAATCWFEYAHITDFSPQAADDPTDGDTPSNAPTAPLSVELAAFDATGENQQVVIRWQTVTELSNLGFNLYRAEMTGTSEVPVSWDEQLNSELIPAQAPGSGQGGTYEWLDTNVEADTTYYYWLEDVDIHGATSLHGSISATPSNPTAVSLQAFGSHQPGSQIWGLLVGMLSMMGAGAAIVLGAFMTGERRQTSRAALRDSYDALMYRPVA